MFLRIFHCAFFIFYFSPVTNTAPLKGFVSQAEKEKESVYVFGSFTYGAKLWPSCLAVSLGSIMRTVILMCIK